MPSVSFSDTSHSKTLPTVTASALPAGGHVIQVAFSTKLKGTFTVEEAARLRDDLTDALATLTTA